MKLQSPIQGKLFVHFILLIITVLTSSCKKYSYPDRLFVNIPPDGIVLRSPWPDKIENLTNAEIKEALHTFIDRYTGKNVASLLFNVNYQRVCYQSNVWDTYWDVYEPDSIKNWQSKFWQLQKRGVDVFKVVTEYSREQGISPWISFRMNDHHYFNEMDKINTFMLGDDSARPDNYFNYENPAIRNHFLLLIEEAVLKYDVDGIELDFLRTPGHYGSITAMNLFMESVKALLDEISVRNDKKLKITVRIPPTPQGGMEFGLDPVYWAKRGWADILVPTNFDSLNNDIPVEVWRTAIGEEAKCMILPGTSYFEYLTEWGRGHRIHQTAEGLRALTVNSFSRGADGIYVYNFFTPSDFDKKRIDKKGNVTIINEMETMLMEGGNFELSINRPRRHILSWHQPGISSDVDWHFPARFEFDSPKNYEIFTGPKPDKMAYIVRLMLDNDAGYETAEFAVKVNGHGAKQIEDVHRDPDYIYETGETRTVKHISELGARVVQFVAQKESIKKGYNVLTVTSKNTNAITIKWIEVHIGNWY